MVGVLDSGDSDWWDTCQSIDDEIRALCVHKDFNHTVSTRDLHDVYEDFAWSKCVRRSAECVSFNCRNIP